MGDLFYVGGEYRQDATGTHLTGQMCVCRIGPPANQHRPGRPPVVLVHRAVQTGTHWEVTPDGRPGLALLLARAGWECYVVDQPGVGRSRYHVADLGPLTHYSLQQMERVFTAPASSSSSSSSQARLHTQWPGRTGKRGDAVFDAFYTIVKRLFVPAVAALLDVLGRPAYLMTHSQSNPLGWHLAHALPGRVKGIEGHRGTRAACITSMPLHFDPPLPDDATQLTHEKYQAGDDDAHDGRREGLVPGGFRQTAPPRQLPGLARVPIVVATAEASYHAAYNHLTVQFLSDAGVSVEHVYLANKGIHGNGHLMALEKNNGEISDFVDSCLLHWESASVSASPSQ